MLVAGGGVLPYVEWRSQKSRSQATNGPQSPTQIGLQTLPLVRPVSERELFVFDSRSSNNVTAQVVE